MLPGLRLLVAAFVASFVVITLGIDGLAWLHIAQDRSAALPTPQARFAGLAFAERADWTPEATAGRVSLELLPPFAKSPTGFQPPKFLLVKAEAKAPVKPVTARAASVSKLPVAAKPAPSAAVAKTPALAVTVAVANPIPVAPKPIAAPEPQIVVAIDPAPVDLTFAQPMAPSVTIAPTPPTTTASAAPADATPPAVEVLAKPPTVNPQPEATASAEDVQLPLPRPVVKAHANAKPVRYVRPRREVRLERRPAVSRRRPPTYARKPAPAVAHKPAPPPTPTNPFAALFGARPSTATAK